MRKTYLLYFATGSEKYSRHNGDRVCITLDGDDHKAQKKAILKEWIGAPIDLRYENGTQHRDHGKICTFAKFLD